MTPRGTVAKREHIPGKKKKFAYLFYLKTFDGFYNHSLKDFTVRSHLIEEEKIYTLTR